MEGGSGFKYSIDLWFFQVISTADYHPEGVQVVYTMWLQCDRVAGIIPLEGK